MGQRSDTQPDNGDVKEKSPAEQVTEAISSALFKAGSQGVACICVLATDDDSIWTYTAGTLVEKLGLAKHIDLRISRGWDRSEEIEEKEDDE